RANASMRTLQRGSTMRQRRFAISAACVANQRSLAGVLRCTREVRLGGLGLDLRQRPYVGLSAEPVNVGTKRVGCAHHELRDAVVGFWRTPLVVRRTVGCETDTHAGL